MARAPTEIGAVMLRALQSGAIRAALEAGSGIEPLYGDLQSAPAAFRHLLDLSKLARSQALKPDQGRSRVLHLSRQFLA